jgi:UDP-glucose 4-epimerase
MKKYIVTGGAGFIGSHLTDALINQGHEVVVIDNLHSGYLTQIHRLAHHANTDITDYEKLLRTVKSFEPDGIFHLAAIARTPWCLWEPLLAARVNTMGTVHVYEAARVTGTKRVVAASSNVIYAAYTPYRATKEQVNEWAKVYREMYDVSIQTLVFSNVYGTRQSEDGPSPNVFAAFRKSLRENGYIAVTGDGTQTRQFTHVSDIVSGLIAAMNASGADEPIDLAHPQSWSMNEVCALWGAPVKYISARAGDVQDIRQNSKLAEILLGWKALVDLEDGIRDVK